eukprot:m.293975 g.293975  ORF g.293975 m.293975 type:complete len:384 (+) comp20026_c0_seq24:313-1464(+)
MPVLSLVLGDDGKVDHASSILGAAMSFWLVGILALLYPTPSSMEGIFPISVTLFFLNNAYALDVSVMVSVIACASRRKKKVTKPHKTCPITYKLIRPVVLGICMWCIGSAALHYHVQLGDNRTLLLCREWCTNPPWEDCIDEAESRKQPENNPALLSASARASYNIQVFQWFQVHVFGECPLISQTVLSNDNHSAAVSLFSPNNYLAAVSTVSLVLQASNETQSSHHNAGEKDQCILIVVGGDERELAGIRKMFAHTSVVDLPAPPMLLPETEREACATGQVTVVAETALAVAAGLKAIYPGRCVSLYGCSRWAKAAVWALAKQSVNKHAAVLDRVYADSPGTLGGSDVKVVGQCGETWDALRQRWPEWFVPLHRYVSGCLFA